MVAMPELWRERFRVRGGLPGWLPVRRRRSLNERAVRTLGAAVGEGARAVRSTIRAGRRAAGELEARNVRLPGVDLTNLRLPNVELPNVDLPNLEVPNLDLAGVARQMRPDDIHRPDLRIPDLPSAIRDAVPAPRRSRQSAAPSTGAVLAAVLVGMLAGLWLATWPVTATRVQAFFEELRSRLGLHDGWSAGSARSALHRIDARTAWREGPLARRRRRAMVRPVEGIAGIAVGPGHPVVEVSSPAQSAEPRSGSSSIAGPGGAAGDASLPEVVDDSH